jgi:signal transduction histidine kinase
MADFSIKIAEGDFSQRVGFTATNELGALAHAFNEMAKRLQSHNEYILESMSNGLMVVDWRGIVNSFNRAASQIMDIPQGEILGRPYTEAFNRYPVMMNAIEARLFRRGQGEDDEINLNEEVPKFLRLRSAPLLGADGQELGMEILFSDETQLRKLQAQIKASEKMATIGELAAGIAHEIRNPLGAMKGFTEILSKRIKGQPEIKEIVSDIATEIEILNKIVTNFLIFARPAALEVQDADAVEIIKSILPLVQQEAFLKGVNIEWRTSGSIWLSLDVEQFRRAILNLILNAIQASPKGGKIILGLKSFSRTDLVLHLRNHGFAQLLPQETEPHWFGLWVEDEGQGIDPGNLKKLFTPFFTTKTEGFGLGLSITRKIAEALGGQVAGVNRPEGGARFMMILPAIKITSEVPKK